MKTFILSILGVLLDFLNFCAVCGPVLLSAYFISNIGG